MGGWVKMERLREKKRKKLMDRNNSGDCQGEGSWESGRWYKGEKGWRLELEW